MNDSRPATPADVARELRRLSGYGCCRCGFPVYQYHHIVPWAIEHHFRVGDMMVLCPTCHDAATKGALSENQQRRFQLNPHNIQAGYVSGALVVGQQYVAIACGGTLLVGDESRFVIDGHEVLKITSDDEGHLEVSLDLEDQVGNAIALVDQNEWVSGDVALWDMTSDHDRLKIWSASRKISLMIDARGTPMRLRADLWHSGQLVRLNSAGLSWDGPIVRDGGIADLGLVGMSLEFESSSRSVKIIPNLAQGILVSEPDPIDRLNKSINAWRQLTGRDGRGAFTRKP